MFSQEEKWVMELQGIAAVLKGESERKKGRMEEWKTTKAKMKSPSLHGQNEAASEACRLLSPILTSGGGGRRITVCKGGSRNITAQK